MPFQISALRVLLVATLGILAFFIFWQQIAEIASF